MGRFSTATSARPRLKTARRFNALSTEARRGSDRDAGIEPPGFAAAPDAVIDPVAERSSAEVPHLEHLADLDYRRPRHRVGATFGPLDRLIEILDSPDPVACGEFTDVRERPFGHRAVLAGKGDARPIAGFLQPAGVDEHPGVDQRLVERAHVRQKFGRRLAAGLGILGPLDDHHDSHRALFGWLELGGALVLELLAAGERFYEDYIPHPR